MEYSQEMIDSIKNASISKDMILDIVKVFWKHI